MIAVPASAPGVRTGPVYHKLGQRGSLQADIFFEDCRVPADHAVTAVGEGYQAAERGLTAANITNAAMCLGVARAAYDAALDWSLDRVQGGVPIYRHQLVANDLGRMKLLLDAAHSYLMRTAWEYSWSPAFHPRLSWGVRVHAAEVRHRGDPEGHVPVRRPGNHDRQSGGKAGPRRADAHPRQRDQLADDPAHWRAAGSGSGWPAGRRPRPQRLSPLARPAPQHTRSERSMDDRLDAMYERFTWRILSNYVSPWEFEQLRQEDHRLRAVVRRLERASRARTSTARRRGAGRRAGGSPPGTPICAAALPITGRASCSPTTRTQYRAALAGHGRGLGEGGAACSTRRWRSWTSRSRT